MARTTHSIPHRRVKRWLSAAFCLLAFGSVWLMTPQSLEMTAAQSNSSKADCAFLQNPETVNEVMARHREDVALATTTVTEQLTWSDELALVPPGEIPRRNYVDEILFTRMAQDNIASAPLCTDEEFIRRVTLDLTGRIPAAADVTKFVSDKSANKRDTLVDALIAAPEFTDKWTMFFGDLYRNSARGANVNRFTNGRDAFNRFIKESIAANKSYAVMVREMLAANGDSFLTGPPNFLVGGIVPMGPVQDVMDGQAVITSSMLLGVNALDCLYCHDGAGHLDEVNLWGKDRTRAEAWGMAAFFARTDMQRTVVNPRFQNFVKFIVSEKAAGEYQLNTDSGNRTPRKPHAGQTTIAPRYIFNGASLNAGETRRQALARLITADRQFARATVNYLWEKLMVEALVSPSDAFDPARLDSQTKLPAGWTLQPANPQLLEALTDDFIKSDYNLRTLLARIAKSSAYQLSAQYPGNWNLSLVPYYARKYVRRLDAEEIHDAVVKATGVATSYQLRDTFAQPTTTVNWAMQFPDTVEPRGNVPVQTFLNSFIRGDRDVKPRSRDASILQALNLMNHTFVTQRIHQRDAGSNVARLLANNALKPEEIIGELYLATLARAPQPDEVTSLLTLYQEQSRTAATEAIQWVLLNKIDFIFNY
jgi:hypothetical protein